MFKYSLRILIRMSKSSYPGVTAMTVFSELCSLNPGTYLPFGILEDRVKSRLSEYLTDGRTRSVKHGLERLERYGMLSIKKTKYGELSYTLPFFLDENKTIFLYLLSAIEDLTERIEIKDFSLELPDNPMNPEEANTIENIKNRIDLLSSGPMKGYENWDKAKGIAIYDPLELIEIMLWGWANKGTISRLFKNQTNIDIPTKELSKWAFLERYVWREPREISDPLRDYYKNSTIERLYWGLCYISEIALKYAKESGSKPIGVDPDRLVTGGVYSILIALARNSVNTWLDLRLKRSDGPPAPTSFESGRSPLSVALSLFKGNLPIGIIEKFNVK